MITSFLGLGFFFFVHQSIILYLVGCCVLILDPPCTGIEKIPVLYSSAQGGGGCAARLFFFFPCSADQERDWPPCKVVFCFFRVGNQCAECEKQQTTTTTVNFGVRTLVDVCH